VVPNREWNMRVRKVTANPGGVFLPEVGEVGPATSKVVMRLAEEYWGHVESSKEMSVERTLEAVDKGDALLSAAGGYPRAATALRQAWHLRHGTHLGGVFDPRLDKLIEAPLVRYLRHQVAYGARTRYQGPPHRVQAKPHPSAIGYMEEFLEKVWKDTTAGRVLLASADHLALEASATHPGTVTAPAGRVPKYGPDRCVLPEGRFIADARGYNEGCDKYRHPPALTPRHRELARTLIWWETRYPGVDVFLSKRDVAAAFKLI
jgi:hypothetical protein